MSWKKDTVNDLHALLTSGDTIAVIDIHGVPASAMFGMRAELRQSMKIQVAKAIDEDRLGARWVRLCRP